jgi:DNA-binding CsgD family transcriptional regulator
MPHPRLTTRGEREALRAVKRACYAGLDSVTLREEVASRSQAAVPTEASSLVATDPDTGLFVHGWLTGVPDSFVTRYMRELYPREAAEYLELALSGRTTTAENSIAFVELMRSEGLSYRARTALCCSDGMWGSWCMFREAGSQNFGEKEGRFLRAVAPHVASGLRSAALMDLATRQSAPGPTSSPGVVVLDARGRVTLRAGAVAEQMDDLASVGAGPELLPYAFVSLLTRLGNRLQDEGETGAELRAQGRSGRWYVLRATRTEPGEHGDSSTVVIVEPGAPPVRGRTLADLYRLTAREGEVLRLVLKGESTKRIAMHLKLSPHTVQDHVSSACAKVGARGRRQLVAKLYADGYTAPDAAADSPPAPRSPAATPRSRA